jgi:hypothetical protein
MCLDIMMIWFAPTTFSCRLLIGCGCVLVVLLLMKMLVAGVSIQHIRI